MIDWEDRLGQTERGGLNWLKEREETERGSWERRSDLTEREGEFRTHALP
jgi:hypothetical protein